MTEYSEEFEKIKLLYVENSQFNRYLIEWRHKIMTRFYITVASLTLMAKWIAESPNFFTSKFIAIPLGLAGMVSLAFLVMDRRNYQLMYSCVKVGADIEKVLSEKHIGYFGKVISIKRSLFTYSTMLNIIYVGAAVIYGFLSLYFLIS